MTASRIFGACVLVLASTGCVATRNDVRILQGDIFALRTQQARADSALAAELQRIATTLQQNLATVSDSVKNVSGRVERMQGDVRQSLYAIEQQLLVLGQLAGQSQQGLRQLYAEMELRNQQLAAGAVPPANPGDTTQRPTPAAPPGEGPYTLYEIGRSQLQSQSYGTARQAFEQLVTQHSQSDLVPLAQLGIADAFAGERRVAEADSVYQLVASRHPSSTAAPTALYRLGLSLERQGKRAEARSTMQRLVSSYPRAEEADLANDWLRNHPGSTSERSGRE